MVAVRGDYDSVRKDFIYQTMLMTHPPAPDIASQHFQVLRLPDFFTGIFRHGTGEIETLLIKSTIMLTKPLEVLFGGRADLNPMRHRRKPTRDLSPRILHQRHEFSR